MRGHIRGRDAANMAFESNSRGPVPIEPLPANDAANVPTTPADALVPLNTAPATSEPRVTSKTASPSAGKPSPHNDLCLAPTGDLEGHREALRQAFGDTSRTNSSRSSWGKLIAVLRPGPHDKLDEATLNAAIAVIASMNLQTELQALLAIQIVAAGLTGLKFLGQSQRHMDEIYIGVYGGYATKLLRLQIELIHALDRQQRGNKQTVEVRHVHIHPGAQGVVGIVKTP